MDRIRVFIGYDDVEAVAFYTLCHSIWKRASVPVQITPVRLSSMRSFFDRERDPLQSNDFSFSRFLVPYMCGFEGFAIWMDCDMLVIDDIAALWALRSTDYAVQCVQHDHVPRETTKYLGNVQTPYPRKNWSSVMLFNNARCRALTPEYVRTASGLDLHQFKWVADHEIGNLPLRWNYLVGYYPKIELSDISNLHFTIGGPYFKEFQACDYAEVWLDDFTEMVHCKDGSILIDRSLTGE